MKTITPIENQGVLIDSNILVYSTNTLSSKYKQAKEFRELAIKKVFIPIIAHQNLFESLRIITHPKFENPMPISKALRQIENFRRFCRIIHPYGETDEITVELIKKYQLKSNRIFDAYLVATMLSNDVKYIATDNEKDVKIFEEIRVFNPFSN